MSWLNHQTEISEFAKELARGSKAALLSGIHKTNKSFEQVHGRRPDPTEGAAIVSLFPYSPDEGSSQWDISPHVAEVTIQEHGDTRRMGIGEFIVGIAVANGIDPAQKDVETAIFYLGRFMGELEV